MHNYPSDISREEFEIIRAELEGAKKENQTTPNRFVRCIMCGFVCGKGRNSMENVAVRFSEVAVVLLLFHTISS